MPEKIFIAGCGYIGRRVAGIWKKKGASLACLVRAPENCLQLEAEGISTLACTLDSVPILPIEQISNSICYYFVPPPGGGTSDTRARNFCMALAGALPPEKIIYISATSVYSETAGGTVNEESPAEPASAMGKRRMDAEKVFLEYGAVNKVPVIILRVSGIYGPGRLPLMQIRQGQPLLNEAESGPSNRIHADDLSEICIAAAVKGEGGDVFNVSDGHPTSMTTYFNLVADAIGAPRQPQVSLAQAGQTMSPLMFSYVSESKVIDNSLMLQKLEIKLRYPNMQQGIQASV
jgi:nucleoside-diphosphate-sugar epimerase